MFTKSLKNRKLHMEHSNNSKAIFNLHFIPKRYHHTTNEDSQRGFMNKIKGFINWMKPKWYNWTHSVRIKAHDADFLKDLLLNEESLKLGEKQAQTMQGRWQAYGQMRAARTTGRFAVLTTGVLGFGLWAYQQTLSQQKKENLLQREEIAEKEKELNDKQAKLDLEKGKFGPNVTQLANEIKDYRDIAYLYKKRLEIADSTVKELCGQNPDCYKNYEHAKIKAQ